MLINIFGLNGKKSICQISNGQSFFDRMKGVKIVSKGIWSNAFDHINNVETNDQMNKLTLFDKLIVYADKNN